MKKNRIALLITASMLTGLIAGTLLSPAPVGAVAKEIVELLSGVNQLQQAQRDTQSSIDRNFTVMKTLIEQQSDATSKLNTTIGSLQKTMQDLQANSGTQLSSMTTQVQGVTDNLGEIQQRMGKINSQLTDLQSTLQTLDSKVSTLSQGPQPANPNPAGGTSSSPLPGTSPANTAPGPGNPPPAVTPPSSQTLYNSALNDILTKKYDLAQQEFQDYLKYYPTTDYASNAVFYLGEIAFVQERYPEALDHYTDVISNFPKSFKLTTSLYKRGLTYLELGKKSNGVADLREVIRREPNSPEAKLARTKLKEMGITVPAGR